ncbi:uncharacterized protein LOC129597360 [Paramacrobiotus metropolitanus]|uniref:uncharacterized protein LOC129597360 n=1 Tax=Paramacrobiotus metropolitanus TaxID=2943436 RepID=UPI0024463E7F|nr:uncharacterized protein LOC129597360 [Paramacrobiotus metropolitanus]
MYFAMWTVNFWIISFSGIIFYLHVSANPGVNSVDDLTTSLDNALYSFSEDSPFLNSRSINTEGKYARWFKRDRIPYYLDKTYSPTEAALITTAIKQVVSELNYWVNFVAVPATSNEYKLKITPVKADGFTPEQICYSFPGMLTVAQKLVAVGIKEQRLVLARGRTGCLDGTIHSIMKYLAIALGLRNEHQRGDRNNWIQIYNGNLTATGIAAYKQHTNREANWQLFPYDYCSVTHNQPEEFSNPGTAAFAVLKPPHFIPKLNRLSESDCKILLMLYSGDPSACTPLNCAGLINPQITTAAPPILNLVPFTPAPPQIKAIAEPAETSVTSSPDGTTTICQTFPTTMLTATTTTTTTTPTTTTTTSTTTTTTPATTPTTTTTSPNNTTLPSTTSATCPPPVCPVCTCVSRCDPITTSTTTSPDTTKSTLATTTTNASTATTTLKTTTTTETPLAAKSMSVADDRDDIPKRCPGRMCSGRVDYAALFLDGESSILISGECAQMIDPSFQLVGDMIPLTDVIPGGAVSGPIQSIWTNMNDEGQFRVHIVDNFGVQRNCAITRCDEEEAKPLRPMTSVFSFQNGDSEDFRTFVIDSNGQTITDETAPDEPIHLSDIRGTSFSAQPLKTITTAWMMYTPARSRVLALIGKDKSGRQYLAEVNVDLSQRPAVLSYIPDRPIMPLFAKLRPCR